MDAGEDVRRKSGSGRVMKLSDTVQGMMAHWTEDQFPIYVETMELIRKHAPVQWVRLYQEAVKMGIEKRSDINIHISMQRDREDLQALVRSRISLPNRGNYVPYEEVKPKEIEAVMVSRTIEEEKEREEDG